ncbi:MAG: hypothetical protein WD316_13300 [Phycisphaeraceae bacterium]
MARPADPRPATPRPPRPPAPPPRPAARSAGKPPIPLRRSVRPLPDADAGVRYEPDGEFLDHARREEAEDQPELPWDG